MADLLMLRKPAKSWFLQEIPFLQGMEDLAAFSFKEVMRAAAKDRERDEYSSAEEE